MAWSTSIPLISDDISADLTAIKENFGVLDTAWQGDHTALAGTGAASNTHTKVTLPQGAAPAAVADAGILYTKATSGAPELFYRNVAGGEAQLTSGGSAAGGASAYVAFNGVTGGIFGTALNITVARTGQGKYTLTLAGLSNENYAVSIFANQEGTNNNQITLLKITGRSNTALTFRTDTKNVATAASNSTPYDPNYVSVVIFGGI